MGTSKVIHALYTDDDVLMAAVKAVKAQKVPYRRSLHTLSSSRIR